MMKYFIGIDSGSTMCKAVLFDGEALVDTYVTKTGWNPRQSAEEALSGVLSSLNKEHRQLKSSGLDELLKENSLSRDEVCITATGYGREAIDFADYIFTEITCHAFGGLFLVPGIQGIIDIGGQDSKVIQIQNGRVVNFLMNDKCAAGTGRFLSMACDTLHVPMGIIDEFADLENPMGVNSMCTVFAESEIIGLLAMQKERPKIMGGVLNSIAQKILQMTSKINFCVDEPLLMTGGLSKSKTLITAISRATGLEIITHDHALFAGAIGACVCAGRKLL